MRGSGGGENVGNAAPSYHVGEQGMWGSTRTSCSRSKGRLLAHPHGKRPAFPGNRLREDKRAQIGGEWKAGR